MDPTTGNATPTDPSSGDKPQPDSMSSLLSQAFTGDSNTVGSPLKKHRASMDGSSLDRSAGFPSAIGDVLGRAQADQAKKEAASANKLKEEEEEEL